MALTHSHAAARAFHGLSGVAHTSDSPAWVLLTAAHRVSDGLTQLLTNCSLWPGFDHVGPSVLFLFTLRIKMCFNTK